MINQKAMVFVEEIYFPNIKTSDGWIDKSKKDKGKYANTVNKKFIFLS